jgi:hypothetical protein
LVLLNLIFILLLTNLAFFLRWGPEAQLTQLQELQEGEGDVEEEERDAEVLCMAFLEPYPTLVCGDSSGVLSFFSVRPSLYKNQLLLRVNVISAITSSAVSFTKVCLFLSNFVLFLTFLNSVKVYPTLP